MQLSVPEKCLVGDFSRESITKCKQIVKQIISKYFIVSWPITHVIHLNIDSVTYLTILFIVKYLITVIIVN